MYNVKSDPARRNEILAHMQEQDAGIVQVPSDYELETMVCQALTYDLKQKLFRVVIPFAGRIRFEGDPRAYGLFSDMIKASSVFRDQKRDKDEAGSLVATEEDFDNACQLYRDFGGHDRDKFEGTELKVLNAILVRGTATQADIQEETGLSSGRVSDVLNGRGRDGHGLIHKCKHLVVMEGRPKKYKLMEDFYPSGDVEIKLDAIT